MSDVTRSDPHRESGNRDKKRVSRPKAAAGSNSVRSKSPPKSPSDVGRALRSVYDATLGERVPDDFLDLLGKLS